MRLDKKTMNQLYINQITIKMILLRLMTIKISNNKLSKIISRKIKIKLQIINQRNQINKESLKKFKMI